MRAGEAAHTTSTVSYEQAAEVRDVSRRTVRRLTPPQVVADHIP